MATTKSITVPHLVTTKRKEFNFEPREIPIPYWLTAQCSPIEFLNVLRSVPQEPEHGGAPIAGAEAQVGAGAGEGAQEPGVTSSILPRVQRGHRTSGGVHHQLVFGVPEINP